MDKGSIQGADPALLRLALGYCPRCGTLRAYLVGANADVCATCVRVLNWLKSTQSWRPRRGRPPDGDKP